MTHTTPKTANHSVASPTTARLLLIATIWQAVLALLSLVGVALAWLSFDLPTWGRVLMTVVLSLAALASGASVPFLVQRKHTGRVLALVVNYLFFVAGALSLLHLLGVFLGIDALAGTLGKGLPSAGIILAGYFISAYGDRFADDRPALHNQLTRLSHIVMGIGALLFLFFIDTLQGLWAIITSVNTPLEFALLGALVLFGAALWALWRDPTAQAMGALGRDSEMLSGFLFLSPNLLGFLLFFAGPLLFSLYISFTDSDAFAPPQWIGLDNYRTIFSLTVAPLDSPDQLAREVLDITKYDELFRVTTIGVNFVVGAVDKLFWISLYNTLAFVIMAVPLSVVPALFVAAALNSKVPGMTFFRAVYFLPSVAAVVGVALIWRWLYNSTVGYINYFITSFVDFVNFVAQAPVLTDPAIRWLADANVALLAVVIIAAWQWMGFNVILFLAGLQNIPNTLYEAATVDGANEWNKFWQITVPLLGPTTFFVVITTTIQAMQLFDQVYVLTNPPGGPGTSTTTIVLYLYRNGFQNFQQGYAAAIAWVLFLLIFGLTLVQFSRQRAESAV